LLHTVKPQRCDDFAVGKRVGSLLRAALLLALAALAMGAIAFAADFGSDDVRITAVSDGTPISGIHPTGEGLPLVGASGTVGAGDYASALKSYHDSGAYIQDLADGRPGNPGLARAAPFPALPDDRSRGRSLQVPAPRNRPRHR